MTVSIGYTVVDYDGGRVPCQSIGGCSRPAQKRVRYWCGDTLVRELLQCKGHAPAQDTIVAAVRS